MKTRKELHQIREEKRKELDLRVNTKADTREKHILVCQGTGCTSSKSPQILEEFKKILKEKQIKNVRVIKTGCFGLCAKGPIVIIRPEDTFYKNSNRPNCLLLSHPYLWLIIFLPYCLPQYEFEQSPHNLLVLP